jgi:ribonuclease BN (tRNA processing enzyme)
VKLYCWGSRGNIATPGGDTIEVGGNTSCYQLRLDDGGSLLVDCGSGAIEYATSLMARGTTSAGSPVGEYHVLISHLHWDHILGFPFFHPIHVPGVRVHLYSPFPADLLAQHMEELFDGTYSPLRAIKNLNAQVSFHCIPPDGMEIAGASVRCTAVDHSTQSFAFRIAHAGKALGYVTDHEAREGARNDAVLELVHGVDLLLHDAQCTTADYAQQTGWGHSSIEAAIDNARRAQAKRLLLCHHDPRHDDRFLQDYVERARRAAPGAPPFELACEGHLYEL